MSDITVTDQAAKQSDQVNPDVSVREQPKEDSLIEIEGQKVTIDELKAGYMRNSDYTKKTQEVAQARRELARQPVQASPQGNDETTETLKALKELGVVTKEDLELERKRMYAEAEDKSKLDSLIQNNPDLASKRKALETIGRSDSRAWEDIVVDYGFTTKDKVSQANNHTLVGKSQLQDSKPKSIAEMSDAEYAAWSKATLTGRLDYK